MVSAIVVVAVVLLVAIVVTVAFFGGLLGKNNVKKSVANNTGNAPAPKPKSLPTTINNNFNPQPYLTVSQAENFIGRIRSSSIRTYNKSAEYSALMPSLASNTTYFWNVSYYGGGNSYLTETIVSEVNSIAAQYLYNITRTSLSNYYKNYTSGVYGNVFYTAMDNGPGNYSAGVIEHSGDYVLLVTVYNRTIDPNRLAYSSAIDLNNSG